MKLIFVIDWSLIPLFIFSAYTGIELHIAGHGDNHEVWHNWAVLHVIASLFFLIAVIFHIATHSRWYTGIMKRGIGNKSKITLVLSAAALCVIITGIILLGVDGENSAIGIFHYQIGILTIVLSVIHVLKRLPALRKSLNKRVRTP